MIGGYYIANLQHVLKDRGENEHIWNHYQVSHDWNMIESHFLQEDSNQIQTKLNLINADSNPMIKSETVDPRILQNKAFSNQNKGHSGIYGGPECNPEIDW